MTAMVYSTVIQVSLWEDIVVPTVLDKTKMIFRTTTKIVKFSSHSSKTVGATL